MFGPTSLRSQAGGYCNSRWPSLNPDQTGSVPEVVNYQRTTTLTQGADGNMNNFPDRWRCHCHQQLPSRFLDVSHELGVWVRDHNRGHHALRHASSERRKTIRTTIQYSISAYACRRDQVTMRYTSVRSGPGFNEGHSRQALENP